MQVPLYIPIPSGLIAHDVDAISHKFGRFAQAGPSYVHFVFDFDRTITHDDQITTWQMLYALLPEDGKRISKAMREKYLALEAAGLLTEEQARQWSTSELTLHQTHRTDLNALQTSIKNVRLRRGVQELFGFCVAQDIPTTILSAGIKNVIELVAREHGLQPTRILSIQLRAASDGHMIDWNPETFVHQLNKYKHSQAALAAVRAERPFTVLIGDLLEDARMVDGDDVLRIRVCKEKADAPERERCLRDSFAAGYDLLVDADLAPVVALMGELFAPENKK